MFLNMSQCNRGRCQNAIHLVIAFLGACVLLHVFTAYARNLSSRNWGDITAPTYGMIQKGLFHGAELFAGPNQFDGNYFHGVLPDGKIVKPAGITVQVGMNPLGVALTPDGKYLVTSNDDERGFGYPPHSSSVVMPSLINPVNEGYYSLSVIRTSDMHVISQINTDGRYFIGLQITGGGPYTIWASGGGDNDVKIYDLSTTGEIIKLHSAIPIKPILPENKGYVSHYTPAATFGERGANGYPPPVPSGFSRPSVNGDGSIRNPGGAAITFPAGIALGDNGKYLYVACDGDNSIAVIDTKTRTVVARKPAGYFPYGVCVSESGKYVAVSNWGVTAYRFKNPQYDTNGDLNGLKPTPGNKPDGFYVPITNAKGKFPKTSSVSIYRTPSGAGKLIQPTGAVYLGRPLDSEKIVGGTHPSAMALVGKPGNEILYVLRTNDDSIALVRMRDGKRIGSFNLSPLSGRFHSSRPIYGAYPNAIVESPDHKRVYIAEAGINAVAVLNTVNPERPRLVSYIPAGWYPTALAISKNGKNLYIVNAKGIGEDRNHIEDNPTATGMMSFSDSNYIFGTAQKVDLSRIKPSGDTALNLSYRVHPRTNQKIVPIGSYPSKVITHVFFIMQENKTFDSMLGNQKHFGPYASTTFNNPFGERFRKGWGDNANGSPFADPQYTPVVLNTQRLADAFSTAVNYYSDSEESDAGHQFCASGTASDYSEKTLLVKSGRGLLVNKNFEPEDYPESGYIFNNAARSGVSFKDYGDMIRIEGTDTGSSTPTRINDPLSGNAGAPSLNAEGGVAQPLEDAGDVTTPTRGLGQSYFLALPGLAVLGGRNRNGEFRLDRNYPGYNFNISDQRRALEFIRDFRRMEKSGTTPQFLYIYLPDDHTGGVSAPNRSNVFTKSPMQQVADGDVALGMVVQAIMKSPLYYNPKTGKGSAIFITYDDAQATLDHIHQHRTPLILVSPYAKPGYLAKEHYSTASIVKTEELLLGMQPNNLGDLFSTDLRDMFQDRYNHITVSDIAFTRRISYKPSKEGEKIWRLASKLDCAEPDQDSERLGRLARLSIMADRLHYRQNGPKRVSSREYVSEQKDLYQIALQVVNSD